MKKFFKTFERVLVYYFASMGISLISVILLNIPLKFIIADYSALVNFIVGIVSLLISIFVLFCRDGYKTKDFNAKTFVVSEVVLLSLLVIVIGFIGRAVYISGPTDFFAEYIIDKADSSLISGKALMNKYCMAFMVCFFVFLYAPLIIVAEYIGVKIRNRG